jgi:hypothetical protein
MTQVANNVVPFRPRAPALSLQPSERDLIHRLLDLAHDADRAGFTTVAVLLVGAAYGVADGEPPGGGGGSRRRA